MINRTGEQRDLPVLARKDSVHAQVLRPRGVHRTARANAAGDIAFRLVRRRRHPEAVISRLNGWPARTPVNASPSPSRTPAHDSGPSWIATPSMSGVLIPFLPPVYPGAPHVPCWSLSRARATYTPDTTRPINRHPPGSSRDKSGAPVSMPSSIFTTPHQWFTCVRLLDPHLTPSLRLFRIAHHHTVSRRRPSSRRESHPPALTDPDVNLAVHPARAVQLSGRVPHRPVRK